MRVPINKILQSAGLSLNFSVEDETGIPGLETLGPISVDLKLTNAETRILAQGGASGQMKVECARCNEDYPFPVSIELEESFVHKTSPEADVTGIEAFEVLTYEKEQIVLDEMLRQNFLATIPIQPICRNGNCKGLCDQCGANLNESQCECEKEDIDPRWAALREIQERSASKPNLN